MKKGTLVTLKTDGTSTRLSISEGEVLAALQKAVGGYIETIPYFNEYVDDVDGEVYCVAFCNEEGKIKNMELNIKASMIWLKQMHRHGYSTNDVLVGDIAIVFGSDDFMRSL